MELLAKIGTILSDPVKFFTTLKEEPISTSYGFFAITIIPFILLISLMQFIFGKLLTTPVAAQPDLEMFGTILFVLVPILMYVLSLIGFWIAVGVYHILFMITGNKESFAKTAQCYVYATVPAFLFGWIPFIGIAASVWTVVLQFISAMKYLRLSGMQATVAIIIIPCIIAAIMFAIMMAIMISLITSLGINARPTGL